MAEISSDFYSQYLVGEGLDAVSDKLLNSIMQNTSAGVQIINRNGEIIKDSAIFLFGQKNNSPDVIQALNGVVGSFEGFFTTTGEPYTAVSYPLMSSGKIAGAVRLVSSLKYANDVVSKVTIMLILFGIAAVFLAVSAGVILSMTITKPVENMTVAAEKMAMGMFDTRVTVKQKDEIGKLASTLNYLAEQVTLHEGLKNEFIASVSHELRTPLSSIKGWAVVLRTGNLDDKYEILEGLDIIEKESDRLSSLLEELLDFSKFQAGKITLKISEFDVNELLDYVKKQLSPRAERQNIKLIVTTDTDKVLIKADLNRLKQVLINIIDNSLKFTPEGGTIVLYTKLYSDKIAIYVEDTGCGIPSDEISRVKEKFYRGENSKQGSGLGLAICNEIISLHKGELEISSLERQWTKVGILLPL